MPVGPSAGYFKRERGGQHMKNHMLRCVCALVCVLYLSVGLLPLSALADTGETTPFTEAAVTEPSVTEAAVTEPKETEASFPTEPTTVTEPTAVTEPPIVTEPTVITEPDTTEPPVTESEAATLTCIPRVMGKTAPEGLTLSVRITGEDGQPISPEGIVCSEEDVGKTFSYSVEEALYDEDATPVAAVSYGLRLRIDRNEAGMLTAAEEYDTVIPEDLPTARVELQGETLRENMFRFLLEGGREPLELGHDAEGTLELPLPEMPDPGFHIYTLRQIPGDADNGYTYDARVYTIVLWATPDDLDQPVSRYLPGGEELIFVNRFTPKSEETVPEIEETTPETEATTPETEDTTPETEATTPETEATTPETEATTPETEATTPETEATTPETEATTPETEATTPETEAAPLSPVTAQIQATVTLTGKTLEAGAFTVSLVDPANQTLTAVNDAAGEVTFALSYSQPGTYVYTLRENLEIRPGMNSDKNLYPVTVTVTEADGQLLAQVAYGTGDGEIPVFNNVYTPPPAQVTLTGTVTLTGRTLKAGEFRFQVTDSAGTVVSTGSNQADGTIAFSPLAITQPGSYSFTVTQVNLRGFRMTYDAKQFSVTVEAFRHGDTLYAGAVYPEGDITFANVYRPPFSGNPGTGDDTPLPLLLTLMGLSGAGLVYLALTALIRRKKDRDANQAEPQQGGTNHEEQ